MPSGRNFRSVAGVSTPFHTQASRLLVVALLVLVGIYLGMVFLSPGFALLSGPAIAVYGLVAAYVLLAMWGIDWLSARWGVRGSVIYFVLQCVIYLLLREVGPRNAYPWMLSMPVVSQAAACLGWTGTILVMGFFCGHMALVATWMPRWQITLLNHIGILCAFTVTIAFTRSALAAETARASTARLASELEAANAQLRAHAEQTAELATLQERNRIARDIHDGLGHYLTVAAVQLQAARALVAVDGPRAAAALEKAEEATRAALTDVRRSVGALRASAAAERPLLATLQDLVAQSGLEVTLRAEGDVRAVTPAVAEALFRAAQEGLTNVRKHAGASRAELVLDFRAAERVSLEIVDSGRGCTAENAGGFGLVGIRERLAALGGVVRAANRPDGGFSLRVEVPQ